jgi:hypothetical protein
VDLFLAGDLGNKFGDEAEYTLIPGLPEKFKQFGFGTGSFILPQGKAPQRIFFQITEVSKQPYSSWAGFCPGWF